MFDFIDDGRFDEGADPREAYKDVVPGKCPLPGFFPQRVKNFDHKKL